MRNPHDLGVDKNVPFDGWAVTLGKNQVMVEVVGQIPLSGTIVTMDTPAADLRKEWHGIVHQISEHVDDGYQFLGLKLGERVSINGGALPCTLNGKSYQIVNMNAVQAVLRRKDNALWIGSKFNPPE